MERIQFKTQGACAALLVGLLVLCASACGKKDEPAAAASIIGSCDVAAAKYCFDYTDSNYTSSTAQSTCATQIGVYSTSACIETGRLGTCSVGSGPAYYIRFMPGYAGGDNGEAFCTAASGTYTSG